MFTGRFLFGFDAESTGGDVARPEGLSCADIGFLSTALEMCDAG
jgi:hypothetical protein